MQGFTMVKVQDMIELIHIVSKYLLDDFTPVTTVNILYKVEQLNFQNPMTVPTKITHRAKQKQAKQNHIDSC